MMNCRSPHDHAPQSSAMSNQAMCIILARAGSKGVPGKNVREVGGRPCIAWTIEAAQSATSVADVVVSTDDPRAAEIAANMSARVVERPAELASDSATIDAAARHTLLATLGESPVPTTPVVLLYANVPVRPAGLVDRAVDVLVRTGCDSVQSYAPVGKYHPWWIAKLSGDGERVTPWEGDVLNHGVYRRQDLPPAYIPDGGVLVVTARSLRLEIAGVQAGPHAFFGADRRGVLTREGEVVDIDDEADVHRADAVLRKRSAECRTEASCAHR